MATGSEQLFDMSAANQEGADGQYYKTGWINTLTDERMPHTTVGSGYKSEDDRPRETKHIAEPRIENVGKASNVLQNIITMALDEPD